MLLLAVAALRLPGYGCWLYLLVMGAGYVDPRVGKPAATITAIAVISVTLSGTLGYFLGRSSLEGGARMGGFSIDGSLVSAHLHVISNAYLGLKPEAILVSYAPRTFFWAVAALALAGYGCLAMVAAMRVPWVGRPTVITTSCDVDAYPPGTPFVWRSLRCACCWLCVAGYVVGAKKRER